MLFENQNVLITGASRGIGKSIAIKLASEGANVAIASKSVTPHPKLEGTIYSAAEEIDKAGVGKVLALQTDIRFEDQIVEAVNKTVETFGGIDILVNNASAINLASTEQTEVKRYDLMHDINVRGTFLISKACIPHLKKSASAHILNISPPLNMDRKWFPKHLAYTMSKYGMSMIVLGLSSELKKYRISVNALWPKTTIATAAVKNLLGGEDWIRHSRKPEIVADAAAVILAKKFEEGTGNFYIDEEVLQGSGVENFDAYAVTPGVNLMPDLFL
jgi:citronellol/citronellal dehydrogenase